MGVEAGRRRSTWLEAAVVVVLLCAGIAFAVHHFADDDPSATDELAPVDFGSLKLSDTSTTIRRAPRDQHHAKAPGGQVVHPKKLLAVYNAPDGEPFAKVRPRQYGDTWLPVIDRAPGWLRVLLPSRPNGSTGWVVADQVTQATSRYLVRVHLASRTLELFEDDTLSDSWRVAVGASATPTPTGRTFVLGQFSDPNQSFSPVIIPLGTHSDSLDSYGGGPGTVALHGWSDTSVFGQAVSHGCIRVPAEALEALRTVPLGTAVLIDDA